MDGEAGLRIAYSNQIAVLRIYESVQKHVPVPVGGCMDGWMDEWK